MELFFQNLNQLSIIIQKYPAFRGLDFQKNLICET
jgi:hypothetical protein